MQKTAIIQIKSTTSRMLSNIPEDWSDVCSIPMGTKHVWGHANVIEGLLVATTNNRFEDDYDAFVENVVEPIDAYLSAHGFSSDIASIVYDAYESLLNGHDLLENVVCVRNDWFKDSLSHAYVLNSDETEQFERLTRSNPMRARKIGETIVETNAYGGIKQSKHYSIDFWNVFKIDIEKGINDAIAARKGGHVRVRLLVGGSAQVIGSV